jgi:hypothetical protein
MNDSVSTSTYSNDADLNFGDNEHNSLVGKNLYLDALPGEDLALNEIAARLEDSVSDWPAGFMLGSEGHEFVEGLLINSDQPGEENTVSSPSYFMENDLLYSDEDQFFEGIQSDQFSKEDFFDIDAIVMNSEGAVVPAIMLEEIELFLDASVSEAVNLDNIFDVMGLSSNRMTDERLYSNEPFIDNELVKESSNSENSGLANTFMSDLDFGQLIDQMADQIFVSNES